MRYGAFLAPWHEPSRDSQILLQEDMELAKVLDELNFTELWVGEHHSGGWGSIVAPELFIAHCAAETRRINFVTGVTPLPYHNPFMVAERALQLDNLTRGRFILGVGAGSGPGDMAMLNIPPGETRARTVEATSVIQRLLTGECVTHDGGWFNLTEAHCQLRPYGDAPSLQMVTTSASSGFGMMLAGRFGMGVASNAAPPYGVARPGLDQPSPEKLRDQWLLLQRAAAEAGMVADAGDWRVAVPVHVAETSEAARDDIFTGWMGQRARFWKKTMGYPLGSSERGERRAFEATIESRSLIVGSPDECVNQLMELKERVGPFGTLLLVLNDWAPVDKRRRSLELFASEVVGKLGDRPSRTLVSESWLADKSVSLRDQQQAAASAVSTR